MNPEERDLLLARYATGQLSESELRRLREAALDDQELFDAMADEEELRDLLADPVARREVVKALEPSRSLSSGWRRPWVWAAAGGMAAAAVLAIVLWKPREQPAEIAMQRPVETPAAAPQQPISPPAVEAPARSAPAIRANKAAPPPVVADQAAKPAPSETAELKKSTDELVKQSEVGASAPLPATQAPQVAVPVGVSGAVSSDSSSWSVRWYVENADGSRKPIETGAEVDRGTTVLAEVRSPAGGSVRLNPAPDSPKEEQGGSEVFTPGETRVFRWRLDQPGPRQLTVAWLPPASTGVAVAPRKALRDAAVAPSSFNQSPAASALIILRVR